MHFIPSDHPVQLRNTVSNKHTSELSQYLAREHVVVLGGRLTPVTVTVHIWDHVLLAQFSREVAPCLQHSHRIRHELTVLIVDCTWQGALGVCVAVESLDVLPEVA
jgi:hypothetical protein